MDLLLIKFRKSQFNSLGVLCALLSLIRNFYGSSFYHRLRQLEQLLEGLSDMFT